MTTQPIPLSDLNVGNFYDLFLAASPDDDPLHRGLEFKWPGFSAGLASATFQDPVDGEWYRDLTEVHWVARAAAAASA